MLQAHVRYTPVWPAPSLAQLVEIYSTECFGNMALHHIMQTCIALRYIPLLGMKQHMTSPCDGAMYRIDTVVTYEG